MARFAGWNSNSQVKAKLQAALYWMRKERKRKTAPEPPTPPNDPHWDSVLALMHFEEGDSAVVNEASVAMSKFGGYALTETNPKFGKCMGCTGNSRVEATATSAQWLLNGPFTLDFQFRADDAKLQKYVVVSSYATNGHFFWINTASNGFAIYYEGSKSVLVDLQNDTWYHFELSRDEDHICRVFVDGILKSTFSVSSDYQGSGTAVLAFGDGTAAITGNDVGLIGAMDEIRFTKGVARHVEDFTPPAEPYPSTGPA